MQMDYAVPTTAPQAGGRTAPWRRGPRVWRSALAAAVALGTWVACAQYFVPQQVYGHWLSARNAQMARQQGIGLGDYAVTIDAKVVDPALKNLSAITYDYDQDRLLAVTNGAPMELLVLSKTGEVRQRAPLVGFGDAEGLAYLGDGRVVIADEKQQRLSVLRLPAQGEPLNAAYGQYLSLQLGARHNNKGFEGVTYDAVKDRLFVIKERDPRALYEVSGLIRSADAHALGITLRGLDTWLSRSVFAKDLSDGYYDAATGHLLLLSDESKNITEVDADGNLVSLRSLRAAFSDLRHDAPQAEGITLDSAGNLYVVSEPNLFYAFKKAR